MYMGMGKCRCYRCIDYEVLDKRLSKSAFGYIQTRKPLYNQCGWMCLLETEYGRDVSDNKDTRCSVIYVAYDPYMAKHSDHTLIMKIK